MVTIPVKIGYIKLKHMWSNGISMFALSNTIWVETPQVKTEAFI